MVGLESPSHEQFPFIIVVLVTAPEGIWKVAQFAPIGGMSVVKLYVPP